MTDSDEAKAALAALAAGDGTSDRTSEVSDGSHGPSATETAGQRAGATADRAVIERAVAATTDIDAAAEFVDSVGLDRLESAVETAEQEVSGLTEDGRAALATFERFRIAAEGPVEE